MLGVVFAVLGVIADAINTALGLTSSTWLLLAIASFAASISWYLGWVLAAYLRITEAEKKE